MDTTATIIVFEEDQYNSMFQVLFADVLELPDVYSVIERNFPEDGIYKFLPSRKLKKLTCGLSDMVYLSYYLLPKKIRELSQHYNKVHVLFHNASLRKTRYPQVIFDFIKKYPITLNLLYLDSHNHSHVCGYANALCEADVFDYVMTFDPDDAKEYGIDLCFTPYSKLNIEAHEEDAQLYFCGSNAGRVYGLYKLWLSARKNNIEVKFDLVGCQEFEPFFENDPRICFHQSFVAYAQLLSELQKSSCILDFTQNNQSGLTLRPYEAVVYNKKLLTNNKHIFEFELYDERYMRYFEHIDDIDWDWVKEKANVDYGYNGEFSPKRLLQKLDR